MPVPLMTILLLLALVCFVLAGVNVQSPRVALVPVGLAFLALALLVD